MKYMGGKYFLCKELSATMKRLVPPDKVTGYVEPFCGALSVLMEMNPDYKCSASDYHPDLIQLWLDVQNHTFNPPEEIDENFYNECKELVSPNSLKAFVGFNMSFGGKFFAGYVDKYKNDKNENFLQEALNSLSKNEPRIQNISFKCSSYLNLKPKNKLIYCDPPYQQTKFPIRYRTDTKHYDIFDNEKFWDVMRRWSVNNFVFISETNAPPDFVSVWEKITHRSASQSKKTRYKNESDSFKTEKLFIHESLLTKINK
jgi:DNA adenine methylase|tara:strand:- start:1020 stop:1793 length:774 start_codon:yes stop_codon:yes gene_type:complete